MSLISYAQNHEDIMLWRALQHISCGFYVDVGANDPIDDSVTKLFYDRGWRGINIEPSAEYHRRLEALRPRDINLECAAGDRDGSILFYDVATRGWSTSDQSVGEGYVANAQATTRQVALCRLDTVLERSADEDIHFLKIDVEGAEAAVLRGLSLEKFRPWVVVVEAIDPVTHAVRCSDWEPQLLSNSYRLVYFDGLNRYYLAVEHSDLAPAFSSPPNVLDGFQPSAQVGLQIRAQDLERSVQDLEKSLERSVQDLEKSLEKSVQDLEKQTQEHQVHVCELEESSRSLLAEAETKYAEITASWSWRITRPLREFNACLRQVTIGKDFCLKQKLITGKLWLRTLLAGVALRLEQFPRLRLIVTGIIRKFPAFELRLRSSLAAQRQMGRYSLQPAAIADLVDVSRGPEIGPSDVVVLPLPAGQRVLYLYVDHTINCSTNTGVQRVARALATSLIERGECVRYVKWDPNSGQCLLINASEREHLARWNGPRIDESDIGVYPAPNQPQVPVSVRPMEENHWLIVPEVTHITFQSQPVTLDLLVWSRHVGLRSGVVFYDAIPLRREELCKVSEKHARYMQQLLLADVVWPISEWSSKDLLSFWLSHEQADKTILPDIQTVSLSGESLLRNRVRFVENGDAVILSVGTIDTRKNQVQLIHAFETYRRRNPGSSWCLTLVGNIDPLVADEVTRAMQADSSIKHLGHVTDQQLDALYQSCAFTVFPSVEEGFGLPIIESLWYGKPCVCADFGSMAEVAAGGGCMTVDTRNQIALESAIHTLITDVDLRHTLANEAITRPIRTWSDYADEICTRINKESRLGARLGLVYYWIDATIQFPKNTGIQRVSRQLARSLMETGVHLIPVKWDDKHRQLTSVGRDELQHFSKWNGPAESMWHDWVAPASMPQGSWFFMPDLPLNRSVDDQRFLIRSAHEMGLCCAAIFYDAIPWKMRSIYPARFSEAHREYMISLGMYDLVLPISSFSRDDLVDFLGAELPRPQSLEYQIKAVSLPGEFAESPRVTEFSTRIGDTLKVLCVGTVEPRKNHEVLLKAFELVIQQSAVDIRLIIAGGSHSIEPALAGRVRAFIAEHPDVITWEENADDNRLRELHMDCDFTVYPSVEEGFGLPILESLWYSKPCVCANFGAMLEVAEGGGCLTVDVRNVADLATALTRMAEDPTLRATLSQEAASRSFKSWQEYAKEVTVRLNQATPQPNRPDITAVPAEMTGRALSMHLTDRPTLSVCVSTFNRAEWLSVSLKNWSQLYPEPLPGVEFLVCDNTSTDHTPDVIKPYLSRPDFSYYRNERNVGMLGNLRETSHHASGKYIWIVGDDDLLLPESIERVLAAIQSHPRAALVYLNYAFTRIEDARTVTDFSAFFGEATPIVPAEEDRSGPIRTICSSNENFFTAIYTLVFRRDHAMRAYSQDTSGRPFSTMPTCIPTTHYVLNHMMEEFGVWIGSPQIVVNMNVSWLKYAPLWILERIPEMYELAELKGVPKEAIDRWRRHTLPSITHYFREIFENDPLNNAAYLSASRLVRRFKHLPEFKAILPVLVEIYMKANLAGHPAAKLPKTRIFPSAIFP